MAPTQTVKLKRIGSLSSWSGDVLIGQPTIPERLIKLTKIDQLSDKQTVMTRDCFSFLREIVSCSMLWIPLCFRLIGMLDRTVNCKTVRTYSRQLNIYLKEILEDEKKVIKDWCDISTAITTDM